MQRGVWNIDTGHILQKNRQPLRGIEALREFIREQDFRKLSENWESTDDMLSDIAESSVKAEDISRWGKRRYLESVKVSVFREYSVMTKRRDTKVLHDIGSHTERI